MLPFSSLNPMSLGKTELTRTQPNKKAAHGEVGGFLLRPGDQII
jgi:hypothetical protein